MAVHWQSVCNEENSQPNEIITIIWLIKQQVTRLHTHVQTHLLEAIITITKFLLGIFGWILCFMSTFSSNSSLSCKSPPYYFNSCLFQAFAGTSVRAATKNFLNLNAKSFPCAKFYFHIVCQENRAFVSILWRIMTYGTQSNGNARNDKNCLFSVNEKQLLITSCDEIEMIVWIRVAGAVVKMYYSVLGNRDSMIKFSFDIRKVYLIEKIFVCEKRNASLHEYDAANYHDSQFQNEFLIKNIFFPSIFRSWVNYFQGKTFTQKKKWWRFK